MDRCDPHDPSPGDLMMNYESDADDDNDCIILKKGLCTERNCENIVKGNNNAAIACTTNLKRWNTDNFSLLRM